MTALAFKRRLHHGMSGPDVKAIKIALKHAGHGSGLLQNRKFGPKLVHDLKGFQKASGIPADGIYGPSTHAKLVPHFTAYARWLYKRTKVVPVVPGTARAAAERLLHLEAQGKLHDDRGGSVLAQIRATAKGQPVINAIGQRIYIHAQVMEVLVWLIDVKGYRVGVFAMCSDHGFDSENGHAGGFCVDISSVDGVIVLSPSVRPFLLGLLHTLRSGGHLTPRQLISGGYANHEEAACLALCVPGAGFYGEPTLSEHCNHAHCGY